MLAMALADDDNLYWEAEATKPPHQKEIDLKLKRNCWMIPYQWYKWL